MGEIQGLKTWSARLSTWRLPDQLDIPAAARYGTHVYTGSVFPFDAKGHLVGPRGYRGADPRRPPEHARNFGRHGLPDERFGQAQYLLRVFRGGAGRDPLLGEYDPCPASISSRIRVPRQLRCA